MTLARLQHIAEIAPAALGADGDWLAEAIRARLCGEVQSLDHALGLVVRGGASIAAQARASRRDEILRKIVEIYLPNLSTAEQARELARRVSNFELRLWPKLSVRHSAPPHIVDTLEGLLFEAFKLGKVPSSPKQLSRIIAGHPIPPLNVQARTG